MNATLAVPSVQNLRKTRPETGAFLLLLLFLNWPLVGGGAPAAFIFSPAAVGAGEWWRLFTHPFVHVSWYHLLLDAGAFIALYESLRETSAVRRLGYVAAAGLGSLGFSWLATPALGQTGLCGLSGIAHGLTAVAALELMASPAGLAAERRIGRIALLFVVAKTAWEAATGQAFLSFLHFGLMGAPVAASHAGGVLGAVLLFAVFRAGQSAAPRAVRQITQPVQASRARGDRGSASVPELRQGRTLLKAFKVCQRVWMLRRGGADDSAKASGRSRNKPRRQ